MQSDMMKVISDSEEMQFYMNHFDIRKNPTAEKIKSWTKKN